jgi:hypothetical protein
MKNLKVKTPHDGWSVIPAFGQMAELVDSYHACRYEVKNCVRQSSSVDILEDFEDLARQLTTLCEEVRSSSVHLVEWELDD